MRAGLLALALASLPMLGGTLTFNLVDREAVEARLRLAPAENPERQAMLVRLFGQSGCGEGRLSQQPVKGSKSSNVVCVWPGETEQSIVVGAHFDRAGGPGAADNWSGAALLPSLLQALAKTPRRHRFVFVGFAEEENGLRGSQAYVKAMPQAERAKVTAMVNLDTLGLGPTNVWASRSDPRLIQLLLATAKAVSLPVSGVDIERVGSTDSESFRKEKMPVITLHSVTQETMPILHTKSDTLERIRMQDYHDTYRLVAAYLALLDGQGLADAKQAAQ